MSSLKRAAWTNANVMKHYSNPFFSGASGLPRRRFIKGVIAGSGLLAAGGPLVAADSLAEEPANPHFRGPNVILIRFGGGARRRETIDPQFTYSPFLCHDLVKRGTLFPKMEIDSFTPTIGVDTSHGQGTLYIITGKYEKYKDITQKFMAERFESKAPTIFEYLRKAYEVPDYQTLIVNGDDRSNEEFYTFSNQHWYGINYRSNTLSL